jgi:hypothetical protein
VTSGELVETMPQSTASMTTTAKRVSQNTLTLGPLPPGWAIVQVTRQSAALLGVQLAAAEEGEVEGATFSIYRKHARKPAATCAEHFNSLDDQKPIGIGQSQRPDPPSVFAADSSVMERQPHELLNAAPRDRTLLMNYTDSSVVGEGMWRHSMTQRRMIVDFYRQAFLLFVGMKRGDTLCGRRMAEAGRLCEALFGPGHVLTEEQVWAWAFPIDELVDEVLEHYSERMHGGLSQFQLNLNNRLSLLVHGLDPTFHVQPDGTDAAAVEYGYPKRTWKLCSSLFSDDRRQLSAVDTDHAKVLVIALCQTLIKMGEGEDDTQLVLGDLQGQLHDLHTYVIKPIRGSHKDEMICILPASAIKIDQAITAVHPRLQPLEPATLTFPPHLLQVLSLTISHVDDMVATFGLTLARRVREEKRFPSRATLANRKTTAERAAKSTGGKRKRGGEDAIKKLEDEITVHEDRARESKKLLKAIFGTLPDAGIKKVLKSISSQADTGGTLDQLRDRASKYFAVALDRCGTVVEDDQESD